LSNQIVLRPVAIARFLGLIALMLVLTSIGTTAYLTWQHQTHTTLALFYLDTEQNIPTFFSSCLLLFAAVLLWTISILEKAKVDADRRYIRLVSCGFLLMAIDEVVSLHERSFPLIKFLLGNHHLVEVFSPIKNFLKSHDLIGFFYFAWVFPAILIIAIILFLFRKVVWRIPVKLRRNSLLAASIYLGGCLGFEILSGYCVKRYGDRNWLYVLLSSIEEGLEMMGAVVFIWVLLQYITDNYPQVQLVFGSRHSQESGHMD
jgi:ABC-type uncharacterized transport system fused permease/ATPase subunit